MLALLSVDTEAKHGEIDNACAQALVEIADPASVDPLLALLRTGNVAARRAAAEALGKMHVLRAADALADAVQHPDLELRCTAACALAALGDVRAVAPLLAILRDPSTSPATKWQKQPALLALAPLNDPRVYSLVTDDALARDLYLLPMELRVCSPDPRVTAELLEHLRRLDNDGIAVLDAFASAFTFPEYVNAAQLRARLQNPALASILLELAQKDPRTPRQISATPPDAHPFSPIMPITLLGHLPGPEAVTTLITLLDTGPIATRRAAARALGRLGDPRAVPPLYAALQHFAAPARRDAADALEALTGQHFGTDVVQWEQWLAAQKLK